MKESKVNNSDERQANNDTSIINEKIEAFISQIYSLTSKVNELSIDRNNQGEIIKSLMKQKNEDSKAKEKYSGMISNLNKRIAILEFTKKESTNTLNQRIDSLNKRIATLEFEKKEITNTLNKRIATLEFEKKEITNTLNQRIDSLNKRIEEKDRIVESLKKEISELKGKINIIENTLKNKEKKIQILNEKFIEYECMKAELNTLKTKLERIYLRDTVKYTIKYLYRLLYAKYGDVKEIICFY